MKGIQLARIHEELKANHANLKNEHKNLTLKHELLQEQYDLLKQKFWGRSSEKAGPEKQPELFDEAEVESVSGQEPEMQTVIQHRQKKRGGGEPKRYRIGYRARTYSSIFRRAEKKCACGRDMEKGTTKNPGRVFIYAIMLMKEQIKSGNVLRMDETRVQVMGEEGRKLQRPFPFGNGVPRAKTRRTRICGWRGAVRRGSRW